MYLSMTILFVKLRGTYPQYVGKHLYLYIYGIIYSHQQWRIQDELLMRRKFSDQQTSQICKLE